MTEIHEWEKWGRQDPYFAVITDPRYRSANIDEAARKVFFDSGRHHARAVLAECRHRIDPAFKPKRVLDFGCGVGRVVLAFAAEAETVVGVDVSAAMIEEARRNCEARGLTNVELQVSDDGLTQLDGGFDLVHSSIVFQHIDIPTGRLLFRRLIELLAPGGIAALHITYGKAYHAERFGQPPTPPPAPPAPLPLAGMPDTTLESAAADAPRTLKSLGRWMARSAPRPVIDVLPDRLQRLADPQMNMNAYNLSELAFLMQTAGIPRFQAEFTDHGGELGVFLYFRKPPVV
jgi:SAM-dependent methyltransferase